jgi:hypothetical protein
VNPNPPVPIEWLVLVLVVACIAYGFLLGFTFAGGPDRYRKAFAAVRRAIATWRGAR